MSENDRMSDEEYEITFDPIHDLTDRWGITPTEAEMFLERVGYFSTDRYCEVAEYFDPVNGSGGDQ